MGIRRCAEYPARKRLTVWMFVSQQQGLVQKKSGKSVIKPESGPAYAHKVSTIILPLD